MFTEPITVSTAQLHLPARRPWSAAIVAWLVYSVSLPLWLLLPWDRGLGSPGGLTVTVGIDVTRIAVAGEVSGRLHHVATCNGASEGWRDVAHPERH